MGMWNNHRLRQAGKYQKKEYKALVVEPRKAAKRAAKPALRAAKAERRAIRQAHRADVSLDRKVKALFAPKVPQRPDLP